MLSRLADPWRPGRCLAWRWTLDFYHACEHLGAVAESLFRDTPQAGAWYRRMRGWLRDRAGGVALKPDADPRKLLPRHVELALAEPIRLDGRPHEFTARVKGNAGWGRLMFEVTDAKGRVFTSCGNQYAGASNGQDPHGQSFVSFAGWQTVRFPLVGMYPGADQAVGWSRNYNWWPTNTPEEGAIPGIQAKAQADHEKALAAYEAAVEELKKAGKKPPASLKKPLPPRGVGRNMGITPVDYPLTLTKVIVDMRPSILYLDAEVPVSDPVVHIDRLGVTQTPDR